MESNDRPVGYTWLIKQYELSAFPLSHESYLGARTRLNATAPGVVQESFSPAYWPGDDALNHIVFALKYDDLRLDTLRQVFEKLGAQQVNLRH